MPPLRSTQPRSSKSGAARICAGQAGEIQGSGEKRRGGPEPSERSWNDETDQHQEAPAAEPALSADWPLCHQAGTGMAAGRRCGCFHEAAASAGGLRRRISVLLAQLSPAGFAHRPALRCSPVAGSLCERQERQEIPQGH